MSAGFAYLATSPITGTAGYPVKRNKSHDIDAFGFDGLCTLAQFPSVSADDGDVRTDIAATVMIASSYKIGKVGVYCSAIDAVTGDAFNIVVGDGTADASGISGNTGPPDNQRNLGYPTAFATAGQLVFGTDVGFTVANFPNLVTTTGGYNEFEPVDYAGNPTFDVCYLPGPLTLRVVTNASTGSITGLLVVIMGCYIDTNCASNLDAQPTVDW